MTSSDHKKAAKGRVTNADEAKGYSPDAAPNNGTGHSRNADTAGSALPVSVALTQLVELQVRRKFYISNVNKQTNAAGALIRLGLGFKWDASDEDREKIKGRAARIVSAALNNKEQKPEDGPIFARVASDLAVVASAVEQHTKARNEVELNMKRIVRTLPIYAWAQNVKGFGELGLAVILAEAGDLANYPKKGHLWKRLGMAPFKDKALSTWRKEGGLTSAEWEEAGYSPRRRAEVYACVSESLLKHQLIGKEKSGTKYGEPKGPYGSVHVRRREHLEALHPDWTPKHCQMDAMRIMTKYLLRDLWREWKAAQLGRISRADKASDLVPTEWPTNKAGEIETRLAAA